MRNQEVAEHLYKIADLMEIKGEMVFKIVAYRRAAQTIESLPRPIEEIAAEGKLDELPGVGRGISETIKEFLSTGTSKHMKDMKKGIPYRIEDLLSLEGVGPKKVKVFYEKLKIKSVKDLEKAAKKGKIRNIKGLGKKTEENILQSIEHARKRGGRMLLGYALLASEEIIDDIKKSGYADRINVAGSIRRMKETIGDIDILVTSDKTEAVLDYFTRMKSVNDVIAKGPTKASVHMKNGIQVDLRVLPDKEYGSALMYFTGSKEHNVELRKIAIAKGMKLSEYGLFKGNKSIAGRTEEEIYRKLGMSYIEPEMRECRGEIELAQKGKLPKLIGYGDIKGDAQMHTTYSDGLNSVEEMARAAAQLGYEFICITDHLGKMAIANAMDAKRLEKQRKEIDKLNGNLDGIEILQGAEIDIRSDGNLDVENSLLKELDIVLAAIHSALKAGKEKNTQRIINAMENQHIDIIAHPSGRLLDRRQGTELDIEKLIEKSKETNTILEIDAQPERLDMNDINVKMAIENGCRVIIDTDAHSTDQLRYMNIGIGTARRGWARKADVINTNPWEKMKKMLK